MDEKQTNFECGYNWINNIKTKWVMIFNFIKTQTNIHLKKNTNVLRNGSIKFENSMIPFLNNRYTKNKQVWEMNLLKKFEYQVWVILYKQSIPFDIYKWGWMFMKKEETKIFSMFEFEYFVFHDWLNKNIWFHLLIGK